MSDRARTSALLLLLAVFALAAAPASAEAQAEPGGPSQVRAGHKGLVGMGLIGAELGLVIPAVSGLDAPWALAVFPTVGAVGGAFGGHYLTDRRNRRVGSVVLLSLGVALVIPAALLTRMGLAFDPDDDNVEEIDLSERAGPGLLRFAGGAVFARAPGVYYLPPERLTPTTGAEAPAELHVPLLSGAF